MKVTKLPIDTGVSGWNGVLPPAQPAQILERDIKTDWLIIGAGFAGLAAARRLCQLQAGDNIVLIDACRVGQGPAGRNSGFMIDLPHNLSSDNYSGAAQTDKDEIFLNRTAILYAQQAAEEAELSDGAFNPCGKVNAAATAKGIRHLENYKKHLSALDEACSMYDENEMAELTGTNFYKSGLMTPGTAIIQPAAFVRGVANHLAKQCILYENTPAISLEKSGANHLVKTPKGSIETPKIILAVNGHIQSFGFYKQQLMHIFTYASTTRKLDHQEVSTLGGQSQWNIIPADPMGTTVRRISGELFGGDRIVVRNRFTYDPSMQINQSRLSDISKNHRRSFDSRFPMLKNVDMEYCWGGRLCISRNNTSAFGEIEENVYSAACQNGLGTTKGTLSGMLVAELAAGCKSNLLDFYKNQEQPRKLLPEPFMSIGAKALLKFEEWQAGIEL